MEIKMVVLKEVIHYPDTNSVEATWVEDGNQTKCHSYSDRQMDMLRADLGADAAEYEALMASVEANQTPLPIPTPRTYQELRAIEFAKKSVGEQLDMQYWDAVNGTTLWIDWVAGIKLAIPKV